MLLLTGRRVFIANCLSMKRISVIVLLFVFSLSVYGQVNQGKRGTIKVRKTGQLAKVEYDNVNYRLIGIDRYGNVLDSAVVEFQLSVTIQGVFYTEKAVGSTLTYEMQQLLGRCDKGTPLFFKNIKARDRNGLLIDIPKFQYMIGDAEN
jgi:hypothetical protein